MNEKHEVIGAEHESGHGSVLSYSVGFLLSILLTGAAYVIVVNRVFTDRLLVTSILALAIAQLVVQLVFFLHLGQESKPRWNFTVFMFMLLVLVILVFGSVWIMNNLNYHMPTDHEIIQDEGVHE